MMRITNGMMMTNTKSNINNNKLLVDRKNTQMSTQKKITRPSDDPLVAIKALRLSTTLSQINQYLGKNIEDAESWLDVTETALTNMKDIYTDAYRLAVSGATDTLQDEDRETILSQLKSLGEQVYAEANADYAGRSIFAGYKTNSTVTFQDQSEAKSANYQIDEPLSYQIFEEKTYYANEVEIPTKDQVDAVAKDPSKEIPSPDDIVLNRLRLSYTKISGLNSLSYTTQIDTSNEENAAQTALATVKNVSGNDVNYNKFEWISKSGDSKLEYKAGSYDYDEATNSYTYSTAMTEATFTDKDGRTITINTNAVFNQNNCSDLKYTKDKGINRDLYTDAAGNVVFTVINDSTKHTKTIRDTDGNTIVLKLNDAEDSINFITDAQGNEINASGKDGDKTVISVKQGTKNLVSAELSQYTELAKDATTGDYVDNDKDGKWDYNTSPTKSKTELSFSTDGTGITSMDMHVVTMNTSEFEEYLSNLAAGKFDNDKIYGESVIFLTDSGELIVGQELTNNLKSQRATINCDYDKHGFDKGDARPEMYFNCVNKTDSNEKLHITYKNYDNQGVWIEQGIDYAISANQSLTVNTQINSVVNMDTYRDLYEMTNVVQEAINAHETVNKLKTMMDETQYADDKSQEVLKDWLEKAQKQADYADDNLKKVCSRQITNFEKYLAKVNLAITEVGSKGEQLALAKNRMTNQKTTFTELKSNNEDEELSDVTIDYTSALTAYQASLQAAGKIDDISLLDFL